MQQSLADKAMIVRLNISQWTARKTDRKATEEVRTNHNAQGDIGAFHKQLIDKRALDSIQKIVGEARGYHYTNTLPWLDDGARMLPSANFVQYSDQMRQFSIRFDQAVDDFEQNYQTHIAEARQRLNGLFNPSEYPASAKGRFRFDTVIDPLPCSDDFRVSMNQADADRIKKQLTDRLQTATAEAMQDLYSRLYDCIEHMRDKMKDKDAIFRNSLVDNLKELVDLLPRLNLTNDPNLAAIATAAKQELCKYSPETLRQDETARQQVAQDADAILASMAGYMGTVAA